jgi:hypothetical protein
MPGRDYMIFVKAHRDYIRWYYFEHLGMYEFYLSF